jgi:hypothetical protein
LGLQSACVFTQNQIALQNIKGWQMKHLTLLIALGMSISATAQADPTMKAGFACFDRDSYISLMADMQEKNVQAIGKLIPDKCVSADTINTFRFDVLDGNQMFDVIGVKFPPGKKVKMYTYPAWVTE